MIRLRQWHWALAFLVATALHLAAYITIVGRPVGEAPFRGGGTYEQGAAERARAAVAFVQLGDSRKSAGEEPDSAAPQDTAPEKEAPEPALPALIAEDPEPEPQVEEAEPQVAEAEPQVEEVEPQVVEAESPEVLEPVEEPVVEEAVESPAEPVVEEPVQALTEAAEDVVAAQSQSSAVPLPRRKPTRRTVLPELETLGRRLPVQQPATAPQVPENEPEETPEAATPAERSAGAEQGQEETPDILAFANQEGSSGTAGGSKTGEIRELNYEDQVLLWLKRHGSYPYEAAVYRLEDVVTLKFAINRGGKILYYELVKKSQYHLLNKAVERMMQRASPVPPIPPEIAKEELVFTIPVRFNLESQS